MEEFIAHLKELKGGVDFENEKELVKSGCLNSFDIIQIVAMVKREYDVKIPAADILPVNFRSAEAMWAIVEKLLDD